MTRRLAALGALLALAAPAASAQESPPAPVVGADTTRLRLPDLLAEVGRANPTLQASLLEAGALSQVGAQVGARPDPVASVLVAPFPVVTARGAQRSQWRVEQPLPWPGTLGLRERSADLAAAVAGYETEALALDLAFEVERAYYDLVHAHHVEGVLRTYEARLDAFAEAAAVRYEVGRGPQGAILQVQLEGEQIAERLYRLAAHRTEALQTLARLTDRPDLVGSPVSVAPPALPDSLGGLLARALRERPEVRAMETARERARTEVALAEKAFYPRRQRRRHLHRHRRPGTARDGRRPRRPRVHGLRPDPPRAGPPARPPGGDAAPRGPGRRPRGRPPDPGRDPGRHAGRARPPGPRHPPALRGPAPAAGGLDRRVHARLLHHGRDRLPRLPRRRADPVWGPARRRRRPPPRPRRRRRAPPRPRPVRPRRP